MLGGLIVAPFLSWCGRRLAEYAPKESSRFGAAAQMVLLPVGLGMLINLIVFQPLPPWFVGDLVGTNSLWVFAAIGAATRTPAEPRLGYGRVRIGDALSAIALILTVRVLSAGIVIHARLPQ